jgi:hypothetical protein
MADESSGWYGGRRRSAAINIVCLGFTLWFGCAWVPAVVQGEPSRLALETPQAQDRVTGTLTMLDTSAGKGMLMTDLEKPVFFRLDRPDLFERLSIGDRVTIQLDEEGRAVKVIEALPAEIHEPPPPAK